MAFLGNFGKNMSAAMQGGLQNTTDNAAIARIGKEITGLKQKQNQEYQALGARYAELFGDAPASELGGIVGKIQEINTQIVEYEKQIRALKGLTLCSQCGAEQDKSSAFCSHCGNRLIPEDAALCPECGCVLPEGALFCTSCGAKLAVPETKPAQQAEPKTCRSCGAVLKNDDVFCTICGTRVSES